MTKSILRHTRVRRLLLYLSGTYLAVFSAIVIPALGIWHAAQRSNSSGQQPTVYWLVAGLLTGFILIIVRNYVEYRRVIYDPHWAITFQDRFDKMESQRSKAAKTLREKKAELANIEKPELADIDDVLDFFEDVGLYQRADHISPASAITQNRPLIIT